MRDLFTRNTPRSEAATKVAQVAVNRLYPSVSSLQAVKSIERVDANRALPIGNRQYPGRSTQVERPSRILLVSKLLSRLPMKPLIISLIKRNAVVALAFVLLLAGLRLVPGAHTWPWVLIPIVFFFSLLWANSLLIKRAHPISAALLSLLLVPILGLPAGIGSFLLGRSLIEWEYKTQGLQMVNGCNALAANMADFDLFALNERLTKLTNSPNADPNHIIQLRSAYAIAQEKARILSNDCRRRGHCDSHPWKTNWITIQQTLAASEQGFHQ